MKKATIAEIDLEALKHNYNHARSLAPSSRTLAVIKANAYGHGMINAAAALVECGVDGLAVANVAEGVALRESGILIEHLIILQGAKDDIAWRTALNHNLSLMVHNELQLEYLLSNKCPSTIPVWVKCDSGMHRLGISPGRCDEVIPDILNKFKKENVVLCSHFACSDEVGLPFNMEQLNILKSIQEKYDLHWSMANSGGILSIPESHGTWNRAGYMLYGNSPLQISHPNAMPLKPVMKLTGPVIAVKDVAVGESVGYARYWVATRLSRIATVAIGYGDGYPRHAPNGTPILVNGRRAQLIGRVSMDMITVDVTDLVDQGVSVCVNDEVCAWGIGLPVDEVAECAGTIGYQLLTGLSHRPEKVFINRNAV